MEDAFIINGGKPLKGDIYLSGAKNVALKVLIAALLYNKPITFHNIPRLKDIDELIHLINELGGYAAFTEEKAVIIDARNLSKDTVDLLHGSKIRVSFMLFAPLLHKFGTAIIPNPGGCRLGARPIDRHIKLLQAFGVHIKYDSSTGYYNASLNGHSFKGTEYEFDKPSHTGTELALLIASVAEGESIIKNAAQEPEVDDLIRLLTQSGASINRSARDIIIHPAKDLNLPEGEFTIMCDRLNAAAFGVFAIATKGDITVHGLEAQFVTDFTDKLLEAGGGFESGDKTLRFFYKGELKATDIITTPHPGFNTDTQGPWAILMTQAHGISTIHETVFENRFGYVQELQKLGAHIDFFQPDVSSPQDLYQFNIASDDDLHELNQAIRITGPTHLHNGVLRASDIRAGASLVIAACVAEGESVILGASIIDRGYDSLEKDLQSIGADIKRV